MAPLPRPPYDPDCEAYVAGVKAMGLPANLTESFFPTLKKMQAEVATLDAALEGQPFTHEEVSVPATDGPVTLSIFRPRSQHSEPGAAATRGDDEPLRPAVFFIHAGAHICGTRFTLVKEPLSWCRRADAVFITVEYRLAPEHQYPVPLEDSYAGLAWVSRNAARLGIDADRLLLSGQSSGGGLAVACAIKARSQGDGPKLCGLVLDTPMLDDRRATASSRQWDGEGTWSGRSSDTAWKAYLGFEAGRADGVSPLAAPGRATPEDLKGLSPTFVSAGSAETFRDEAVNFAKTLWAAGVQAELHIWPGGIHCFDALLPDLEVSKQSNETRAKWVVNALTKQQLKQ